MEIKRATIADVKKEIELYKGCRVTLEAHKSKKKLYRKVGVIEAVYPCIFTVSVHEENRVPQRLSFSYTDVLTQSVKITLEDSETPIFTY